MNAFPAICQHSATYVDEDEIKCRSCNSSITFPRRVPTVEDERARKHDLSARHRYQDTSAVEVEDQEDQEDQGQEEVQEPVVEAVVEVQEQVEVPEVVEVVEEVQEQVQEAVEVEVIQHADGVSAPSLLCTCCKQAMAPEAFHVSNRPGAKSRGYRAARCRPCTAFANRTRRQQDPEGVRQRDKERADRYRGAWTPEQRMKYRTTKAKNNLAAKRHRARLAGIPVLIQTAGRLPTLVKPVCRIYQGCPLRQFCTVEGKNLA